LFAIDASSRAKQQRAGKAKAKAKEASAVKCNKLNNICAKLLPHSIGARVVGMVGFPLMLLAFNNFYAARDGFFLVFFVSHIKLPFFGGFFLRF